MSVGLIVSCFISQALWASMPAEQPAAVQASPSHDWKSGQVSLGVSDSISGDVFIAALPAHLDENSRSTCMRLISAWRLTEITFEQNEMKPLCEACAELMAQPGWRGSEQSLGEYSRIIHDRNRFVESQVAREHALIAQLAAEVGVPTNEERWASLASKLEAVRNHAIACELRGAGIDLTNELPSLAMTEHVNSVEIESARREYLRQLHPLWTERRRAWQSALQSSVQPGYAYLDGPGVRHARLRWARSSHSIQLLNEWWARHFGSLLSPSHGSQVSRKLFASVCPSADVGWSCEFVHDSAASEKSADPTVVHALLANWRSRCDQICELSWAEESAVAFRVLAGEPCRPTPRGERHQRILDAFVQEAEIHVTLLGDLGVEFRDHPCLLELLAAQRRRAEAAESRQKVKWYVPETRQPSE